MKNKILFICGTDTNVGKTIVLGAMLSHLTAAKANFRVFKPFESGTIKGKRSDTEFLRVCAANRFTQDEINLHHFAEPLAPGIAAKRAGKKIDFPQTVARILSASRGHEITLVEGAGGLLVPLAGNNTNLDLIRKLKAQVILVARLELGTINHTRLTYDRLKAEKIPVAGIILNQTEKTRSIASRTNPQALKDLGLPILGIMPYVTKKTPANLRLALPSGVRRVL